MWSTRFAAASGGAWNAHSSLMASQGRVGIQEVRLNPSWWSVILTDDPARWTGDELVSPMQALSFDQLEIYQPRQPHGEVQISASVTWLPLALAAAAQQRLAHPVTEAIVRIAQVQGIRMPECTASEYAIGPGVEASVVIHSPPAATAVCLAVIHPPAPMDS